MNKMTPHPIFHKKNKLKLTLKFALYSFRNFKTYFFL